MEGWGQGARAALADLKPRDVDFIRASGDFPLFVDKPEVLLVEGIWVEFVTELGEWAVAPDTRFSVYRIGEGCCSDLS